MFCSNCGNKVLDKAKFCSKCGDKVVKKDDIQEEKKILGTNNTMAKDLKGVRGWLVIPIIGFLLFYPLMAIYNFFYSEDFLIFTLFDLVIAIFAAYTGYLLIKIKPKAVQNAKSVFALSIVSNIFYIMFMFTQYEVENELANDIMYGFVRSTIASLIWLMYFYNSKRVKETYKS